MTTNVTIHVERREGVISVPLRAVKRKAGVSVVQVQGDEGSKPREVRAGLDDGEFVEIVEGLQEGDTVVYKAPKPKKPARPVRRKKASAKKRPRPVTHRKERSGQRNTQRQLDKLDY